MNNNDHSIIQQYMHQLKVNVIVSDYHMVANLWKDREHLLNYSKLYYIEAGEGVIYIDGEAYYPKANDVVFIPSGSKHSYETISSKRFVKYWCHFNATLGNNNLIDLLKFPYINHINDKVTQTSFTSAFSKLISNDKCTNAFSPLMTNGAMLELINLYFNSLPLDTIKLKHQSTTTSLHHLLTFMEENLSSKLTLQDLSKLVNLHPNYLVKVFHNNFGLSPIEYLNRLRITKAKELLAIDAYNIKTIANLVGFSSPYYFSMVFKKYTGFTPSEFKAFK